MTPASLKISALALVLGFAAANASHAGIVFFDNFEDGPNVGDTATKLDDAFDATDVNWYSALSNGSVSVVSDAFAGGGSAKALQLSAPDTFRRMTALFPSTTLGSNVGDKLILSFDMRFVEAPASNIYGLRFGLYDSNGTSISSDNPQGVTQPTAQNDDYGYYVRTSTGSPSPAAMEIMDEPSGDNPTGGGTLGSVIGAAGSPVAINDLLKHSFVLTVERTGVSSISLALTYDNVLKATATDNTPVVTFDTIYLGMGSISSDFLVDNVKLETASAVVIPEPSSLALGLAGVGLLTLARRRR